MKMVRLFLF